MTFIRRKHSKYECILPAMRVAAQTTDGRLTYAAVTVADNLILTSQPRGPYGVRLLRPGIGHLVGMQARLDDGASVEVVQTVSETRGHPVHRGVLRHPDNQVRDKLQRRPQHHAVVQHRDNLDELAVSCLQRHWPVYHRSRCRVVGGSRAAGPQPGLS
eukprot:scaffold49961_cov41-Prasinocladus_malaysianus.AAC.1